MGRAEDDFEWVNDRRVMACAMRLDSTKLRQKLGWEPAFGDFEAGLAATIGWYREHADWWAPQKTQTEAKYQHPGR